MDLEKEYVELFIKDRDALETAQFYTDWVNKYQKAMDNARYNGPRLAAEAFDQLGLDKNVRILDVGAGTGRLGEELKKRGYSNLDALEPSEMITKAKEKQIYKNYYKDILKVGHTLNIPKDQYDATVMSGVLTPGHIHIRDVQELTTVVKNNGLVTWCMTLPSFYESSCPLYSSEIFEQQMKTYLDNGIFKYAKKPVVVNDYYHNEDGLFYAMTVTKTV